LKHFRVYWLTCVVMIAAMSGSATTIVLPTDDQLIAKSPVIIEATVVSSLAVERNGRIWTETTLSVERALKGGVSGEIIVREIGGVVGDRITKVFGTPEYAAGERVLAFLTPTPRGDYQTVDLYVGKFTEARTLGGERLWHRDDIDADVALLDADFRPHVASNAQRRADAFEQYVAARVANKSGDKSYVIENPILQRGDVRNGGFAVKSNFTLISEPTVYRWFTFEQNGTARWYSQGTQPGYTGGGVNEISTAMSAWTGYASALIRYSYSGAASGNLQPLSTTDGINGILFNDPHQEIAGTYNAGTGGIVGQGGFNGVSGSSTWTSPFAADASHPAQSYRAYNITEGGLVIQDGVTPSAGISSTLLAEIVAHEFGHTLGLGHSSDSTALMYPTVTGRGPSLRADDQLAARWLYPNGSSTPPPPPPPTIPAAPSGLTATPSGTSVNLRWTDNAGSNETGESVYYAASTGSFVKVGNVAAGTTSLTLNGFSAGTYRFYVTSYNSAGESAASNTASATIASTPPPAPSVTAAFSFTPASPTTSTNVTFIDQSSGTISTWSWNFGDGSTSAQQNPIHRYAAAGAYNVTLTVSGGGASSNVTHAVNVANPAPVIPPVSASFDFTPSAPTTVDSVSFFDRSSGSPTAWSWSFGDGSTSAQQNPQHRFAAPGTYVVTMTATNSASSATTTRSVTVAAIAPYRSLVSASAQTNGAGGTVWRTELTILNAGGEAAFGQLILLPGAGGTIQSRPLFLAPRQSITYGNALLEIFGMPSGAGAIAIEANSAGSTPVLKVTSRTFTTSATGGTYGQAVPEVTSDDLQSTLYITGIESDSSYRTNIGLVNRTDTPVGSSLTLFDANGNVLGTSIQVVPANNFGQGSLAAYFPAVNGRELAGLSMRVDSATPGAISTYASVIDNRTQDPIYIQGSPLRSGTELMIPAVGRAGGANGTFWRSDVTIYNPTASTQSVSLLYLASGADNRTPVSRSFAILPGRTVVFADVLQSVFGLGGGTGALAIRSSGNVEPVVTSRTYTSVAGGGTYGQSIDPVLSWDSDAWVPGLRSDSSFRSNVGFVNTSNAPISVGVTLVASNGQSLAAGFASLPPRSMSQISMAGLFPGIDVASFGSFALQAHTDSPNALFVYGSIVDNSTGDPVFYAGQ